MHTLLPVTDKLTKKADRVANSEIPDQTATRVKHISTEVMHAVKNMESGFLALVAVRHYRIQV